MVWTYLGGALLSFSHIIPCLWSIQIIGRLFLNSYFSCFLYVCSVCLRLFIFQVKKKNNSSASILNSYNWFYYPKEYILFKKRLCFKPKYYTFRIFIPSLCCFFFLSSPWGSVCCFFFPRGARGHAVVIVNDPFSDLPFFGSEESLWSEIINPFLDSPKKTPNRWTFVRHPISLLPPPYWKTIRPWGQVSTR